VIDSVGKEAMAAIDAALLKEGAQTAIRWIAKKYATFTDPAKKAIPLYLTRAYSRCVWIKTIINSGERLPVDELYTAPRLRRGRKGTPFVASIASIADSDGKLLIRGTAGIGKSTVLRHLFLEALQFTDYLPVYIELRQLQLTQASVLSTLLESIGLPPSARHDREFKDFARRQKLLLLLDGLDELPGRDASKIELELRHLADDFERSTVVLSSRPSTELVRLAEYEVVDIVPFNKAEAVSYAGKLVQAYNLNKGFVDRLRAGDFAEHEDFLSIPLLLSIMLLIYQRNEDVPVRITEFYSSAFEALAHRHDSLKDPGFERPFRVKIGFEDRRKLFGALSFLTHVQGHHGSVDRASLLASIAAAGEIARVTVSPSDFVEDLATGLCLLIEEGSEYLYAHRSFQEYFAAEYICQHVPIETRAEILGALSPTGQNRKLLDMLFEINGEMFEVEWALPKLHVWLLRSGVGNPTGADIVQRFVETQMTSIDGRGIYDTPDQRDTRLLGDYLLSIYSSLRLNEAFDRVLARICQGVGQGMIGLTVSECRHYPSLWRPISSSRELGRPRLQRLIQLQSELQDRQKRSRSGMASAIEQMKRLRRTGQA